MLAGRSKKWNNYFSLKHTSYSRMSSGLHWPLVSPMEENTDNDFYLMIIDLECSLKEGCIYTFVDVKARC